MTRPDLASRLPAASSPAAAQDQLKNSPAPYLQALIKPYLLAFWRPIFCSPLTKSNHSGPRSLNGSPVIISSGMSKSQQAQQAQAMARAAVEAATRRSLANQQGLQSGGGSGFIAAWAMFGFGTLGGAAYGIYLGKEGLKKREIEAQELKKEMHAELERIAAAKERSSGGESQLFKKAQAKGPPPTQPPFNAAPS